MSRSLVHLGIELQALLSTPLEASLSNSRDGRGVSTGIPFRTSGFLYFFGLEASLSLLIPYNEGLRGNTFFFRQGKKWKDLKTKDLRDILLESIFPRLGLIFLRSLEDRDLYFAFPITHSATLTLLCGFQGKLRTLPLTFLPCPLSQPPALQVQGCEQEEEGWHFCYLHFHQDYRFHDITE